MMSAKEEIRQNLDEIRARIAAAAARTGRSAQEILLLGVSKTVEPERINIALDYGISAIGENKAQELCGKYDALHLQGKQVHFIGHLQTNKINSILDKVDLIHSVDTLKLATAIDERAARLGKVTDILAQINISDQDSKFGMAPEQLADFLRRVSQLKHVCVRGLMTIPRPVQNPEDARADFRRMYKLFVDMKEEKIDNVHMDLLSMGMSADYEIAIEEGANIVRIGTSIFGRRKNIMK